MINATCKATDDGFVGQCKIEGSKKQLESELTAILSAFITDKKIIGILSAAMDKATALLEMDEEEKE